MAQDSDIGATISVEVTALDGPTVTASSATPVVRSAAPTGGVCGLGGVVGDADSTVFTVSCSGWSDYYGVRGYTPLTYELQWWGCDSHGDNCSLEKDDTPTTNPQGQGMLSGFSDSPGDDEYRGLDHVTVIICEHDGSCTSLDYPIYLADDGRPYNNPASPPTINGHVWLGETLSADRGAWSGSPNGYSYQWMNCADVPGYEIEQRHDAVDEDGCAPIAGATGETYTVQPKDLGSALVVEVTATNGQGPTVVDSPTTRLVVHAPPTNTARPTVTGTNSGGHPVSGDTLTAARGSWTGDTSGGFSYQWQRCDTHGANCNPISGATSATYTVQPSDIGSTIVIDITATNGDGLSTDAISLPTSVEPTAPSNTVQPQIETSSPLVGTQVSATTGTWTGPPAPAGGDFAYQWYRCRTGCTRIDGATAGTYTPVEDDFGDQLAVVVTASTLGGSASSDLNHANLTHKVAHADVSVSIDSGPDDATDSTSATFTFSSNDDPNVNFECRLDEHDMSPCSSPVAYSHLSEGDHSFSVHATDSLGLESGVNPTDPVREWTVDTTAPVVTIDSAPSGSTSATTAGFRFHADDPNASFECTLDGGSWTACASPRSYSSLALGDHSFRVRATDAAENVSAPVSAGWAVLAAPTNTPPQTPTPTPTPTPANPTTPTPPTLTHVTLSEPTLTKTQPVKVTFAVNKPGTVTIAITRALNGKTKKIGTVTLDVGKAGQGHYLLRTRIGRRSLLKGRYTLALQLAAGTQHSTTVTKQLTVR